MTVDFTKFAFSGIRQPFAPTIAEAIRQDAVASGFVVVTVKVGEIEGFIDRIRAFVRASHAEAADTGLADVTVFREIRPDEWGGVIPFDQAICEKAMRDAERHKSERPERFPTIGPMVEMTATNGIADWAMLLTFRSRDQASRAASETKGKSERFETLVRGTTSHTVGAFENTDRYADVSRNPDLIHFFNFFPGPGDAKALSSAWQDAMPWFFEVAEFRSSLPLVALDHEQPLLVVNYAHIDSMKHFMLGVAYDPSYLEAVTPYVERGFKPPKPFFCKMEPV